MLRCALVILALVWWCLLGTTAYADTAYAAEYAGASAPAVALPGSTAELVAVFVNTGTATWEPGVVGLIACVDGEACREPSADYDAGWYGPDVYATVDAPVTPGGLGFFIYSVRVPGGTAAGTDVSFDGTPGLIATRMAIGSSGYAGEVTVPEPGVAARLTISGVDLPQTVGNPLRVAVDVDDVNVFLVGDDNTTDITAALDPATCSGAAAGPAYLESPVVTAAGGRVWFTVRSFGAYPSCRLTVTSPGLRTSATTIEFDPGAPVALSCDTDTVALGGAGAILVESVDAYGNRVRGATGTVTLARVSGSSTDLASGAVEQLSDGAAIFAVAARADGEDVYSASLGPTGYASASCRVRVTT